MKILILSNLGLSPPLKNTNLFLSDKVPPFFENNLGDTELHKPPTFLYGAFVRRHDQH